MSTGQGFVGSNMFAYCNNNSVNYSDSTGQLPIRNTVYINDGGSSYYGGSFSSSSGIPIVPPIIDIEEILESTATTITAISEIAEELWDSVAKSFARSVPRTYKSSQEEHHLVAKAASGAKQAAAILNEVLPGGVENPLNKMYIKTGLHRRLHTNLYYTITNQIVISAYMKAGDDKMTQRSYVIAALGAIRSIVAIMDVAAPY